MNKMLKLAIRNQRLLFTGCLPLAVKLADIWQAGPLELTRGYEWIVDFSQHLVPILKVKYEFIRVGELACLLVVSDIIWVTGSR